MRLQLDWFLPRGDDSPDLSMVVNKDETADVVEDPCEMTLQVRTRYNLLFERLVYIIL